MDTTSLLQELFDLAWARHQNPLSWYIRPLFILPLAFFAYRRSPGGIALTIVAMLTSMAWFPVPGTVDPRVLGFLEAEQRLFTEPTPARIGMLLLAPLALAALCAAFWRRSIAWGLVVVNAMALGKILWAAAFGGESGGAVLVPALAGMVLCDAAIVAAVWWSRAPRPRSRRAAGGRP